MSIQKAFPYVLVVLIIIAALIIIFGPRRVGVEDASDIGDNLYKMDEQRRSEFEDAAAEARRESSVKDDPMSSVAKYAYSGEFKGRYVDAKGNAYIVEGVTNNILRFEGFSITNGPDVRVYLSTDLIASDFKDLGELKATKGFMNYEVPKDVDLSIYDKVLVWSREYGVLWAYAELS